MGDIGVIAGLVPAIQRAVHAPFIGSEYQALGFAVRWILGASPGMTIPTQACHGR
jgi:hypothetical protein